MNIFFWQNILSPHQLDFLKELSNRYEVFLVVEKIQDEYRKKDGWEVPDTGFLKNLYISPSESEIQHFYESYPDAVHVFSGISAYKLVYKSFKIAIKKKAKIGIISEPINLDGFGGLLKYLRGVYQCWKFGSKIQFIAATGELGVKSYLKFGYKSEKVFHWGYFVNVNMQNVLSKCNEIIYVGNINKNKQILPLVSLFIENNGLSFERLIIAGTGNLLKEIKFLIKTKKYQEKIKLLGRLPSDLVYQNISKSKVIVLPSLSDGWGVVVNEALLCGTPVIASSNVGANVLLNGKRGTVFEAGNLQDLKRKLIDWSNKKMSNEDYENIKKWAELNIHPVAAVSYFEEIINYVFGEDKSKIKPIPPWLSN